MKDIFQMKNLKNPDVGRGVDSAALLDTGDRMVLQADRVQATRHLQGHQLYMAVLFLSSVRYWTLAYTSVTFYKFTEHTAMFIW